MNRNLKAAIWCFVLAGLLALTLVAVAHAGGADRPPATIRASVQLRNVYCAAGVCCGAASATYHGHHYTTGPRGYCRWFHPLQDGQTVVATLYLAE